MKFYSILLIFISLFPFRSGKTSIIKLIFEKMTAGDTLKLPETKIIQIHGKNHFIFHTNSFIHSSIELTCGIHVRFQIRDVPGPKTASLSDLELYVSDSTTIIYVLDVTVR
jgi:hypothetical protein